MIELDDGFTCAPAGPHELFIDGRGDLCFACDQGTHAVDGQADDGEHLVGIWKSTNKVEEAPG